MWYVEYYIAGHALPHTRVVQASDDATPASIMESLALGRDIMSVTLRYVQDVVNLQDPKLEATYNEQIEFPF